MHMTQEIIFLWTTEQVDKNNCKAKKMFLFQNGYFIYKAK
jgi:hypothetical protein